MGLLNTLQFLDFESALTFVSCLLGLVLCFPFATEFGVFVVYFLDYIVGSAWWVIVLHLVRNCIIFQACSCCALGWVSSPPWIEEAWMRDLTN